MKKLLILLSFIATLGFGKMHYQYDRLADHQWYEIYFKHVKYASVWSVLVRLNSEWEVEMKNYNFDDVVNFKDLMDAHHYDYTKYHKLTNGLFHDYRVIFTCDDFIQLLNRDSNIKGMELAY